MHESDFDFLLENLITRSPKPRGYVWKVVVDPTRDDHDAGLFYGRLFRAIDLHLDREERSSWPNGIVFENIISGVRLTYQKGLLIDQDTQRVIRNRSRKRQRGSQPGISAPLQRMDS